ncbi:hypothetical protein B0T20DRAFT_394984 [Sordaria brevicollis]|uniref:Uncharacterized protein n=1 Tax=Sordaria brevicollis TaxID=83679 RepID=A0AAE0PBD0_SORBR|nr:hypothetical protein B0T20DRAFT_366260 [Sordaria brevicollis]KAK3396465.1 hypothetical protein B0T20DRAFT_394984 [Sordaria brevicollis]
MKGIIGLALAAAVSGVVAQPHNHHGHHHAKKHTHGSVDKRADAVAGTVVVTKVVQGPTVVEYVLDGKKVPAKEAEKGIKEGGYVVLGSSKPSFVAPPPVVSTSIASVPGGAQFFAKTSSTSTSTSTSSSTTSSIPTTSSSPIPSSTSSEPPAATSSAASDENITGGGLDSKFPSGKIRCDHFPSDFGALYVDWVGLAGWTTLAKVPGGRLMKGVAINNYEQPITGPCQPGMLCSYACPPGYQKTQWPEENQGATGQSIGGLYCNTDGYLELTRENHPTLCEPGAGGVYVKNLLPKSAAICRTDYPGNEAMVIPLETNPGGQYPLTNPVSSTYYKWKGQATTAQYYVNNMGIPVDDACTWNSKSCPDCAGNWAPVNVGVGKSDDGITYISIFPNAPTTTAILNFDMEIKGDISGECWLKNGEYSGNNGCTVGLREGGTATVILKPRGA